MELIHQVNDLLGEVFGNVAGRHVNFIRFLSSIGSHQKLALFILFCVYANDQLSRYVINYLYAEPSNDSYHSISMATNISSFGYGNVVGFGFSLSFVFFGAWVARMINHHKPKHMLLFGMITWCVGTLMLSHAVDFGHLMGSRIILGLGQAFCAPAAYALLVHYFPQDEFAPLVRCIFGYGSYVGIALSSLSLLLLEDYGWKSLVEIIYISGFVLVVLVYFAIDSPPKPPRAKLKKEIRPVLLTLEDVFLEIRRNNALMVLLFAGCIRFMAEYVLVSFSPLFFLNKFPDQKLSFCILNALIVVFVGGMSSLLGSASPVVLALDKPGCVRGSCSLLILLVICTLLAIPALLLMLLIPSFYGAIFGLFLVHLLTEWWFRPFLFIYLRELSPEGRNIGLGYLTMTSTLAGSVAANVVGYFIGRKDDNLHGNVHVPPRNVTVTMAWATCVIYFLSALLFTIVYIMLVQDEEKLEKRILQQSGMDESDEEEGEHSRLLSSNTGDDIGDDEDEGNRCNNEYTEDEELSTMELEETV